MANKARERVIENCRRIEKSYNVKILFAVESGSRAWRISSGDSDYDVRFVFARQFQEYLKISKPADVIERNEGGIDIVGFDIYKFCGLLKASNPAAIEWLVSDIVYCGEQPKELVRFARENFNPKALYWHYKSMCKQNYLKYLKGGKEVTYKKYLYAMRGLINAKLVQLDGKIPPTNFLEAMEAVKEKIPEHVYRQLQDIIKKKKSGKEKEIIKNIVRIDSYIESELEDKRGVESAKKPQLGNKINEFILKTLGVQSSAR